MNTKILVEVHEARAEALGDMAYRVRVEPSGEIYEVARGQTILDAALRAGVQLPHACSHGVCATCKVQLRHGKVDMGHVSEYALIDVERADNKCLACSAVPTSDLVIEAGLADDADAELRTVTDYSAVVTSIKTLSPTIKSIFLALDGDGIEFQAGQYINLSVPGSDSAPRAFSIASPPSSRNVIELNVALVEEGDATRYLHQQLRVGDTLDFSGPYGQFYVRKSCPEPIIFLAGGSGLSGVKSMIMELIENSDSRPMTLLFAAQTQQEVYYRELFEHYARQSPNFNCQVTVSEQGVHQLAKAYFGGGFKGYKVYVCGLPQMVDRCVSTLMLGGCPSDNLFVERFYNNGHKN